MKKKIVITIAILIILLGVGFFAIKSYNESKEFTLCEIKTYDDKKIENYSKNKRSFIICNYDSNAKITVNDEEYIANKGFYKEGKYKIKITVGDKTEKRVVKINKVNKSEKNKYNIYISSETLPTLFASFDMIKQKDVPSYVWCERKDTLNMEELKNMFSNVVISEHTGSLKIEEFIAKIKPEIQKFILDKLSENEDAYFNVYVTAEHYWMGLISAEILGLSEDRVQTTMYSCGTVDYVLPHDISEKDSIQIYENKKKRFDEVIDNLRSNIYGNSENIDFLRKEGSEKLDSDFILLNTLRDNVTYYLQFPELIKYEDEKVKSEMEKANMQKILATSKFKELTDEQKNIFFKCINLDKAEFDNNYFNSEKGKYLIITGTRPYYGDYTKAQFESMMNTVINKYSNEYQILYKPHPMAIPDEAQQKYLKENNINILPGRLPMEAICFVYDNIKLGGFASSLYMSVDKGNTLFFFEENKENLVEPLNILYDDLFNEAEFVTPK